MFDHPAACAAPAIPSMKPARTPGIPRFEIGRQVHDYAPGVANQGARVSGSPRIRGWPAECTCPPLQLQRCFASALRADNAAKLRLPALCQGGFWRMSPVLVLSTCPARRTPTAAHELVGALSMRLCRAIGSRRPWTRRPLPRDPRHRHCHRPSSSMHTELQQKYTVTGFAAIANVDASSKR